MVLFPSASGAQISLIWHDGVRQNTVSCSIKLCESHLFLALVYSCLSARHYMRNPKLALVSAVDNDHLGLFRRLVVNHTFKSFNTNVSKG